MEETLKLNLGCGPKPPVGWTNVDYAIGAKLAKFPLISAINKKIKVLDSEWERDILVHDLRKRFPWADNSVRVIYSSHTLEHFSRAEGVHFLRECWRVLYEDGIVRIVVPDLRSIVDQYLRNEIQADRFLEALIVGYEDPKDGQWKRRLAPFFRFPHKCMYDKNSLLRVMSEIGFECSEKQPFESEISDIYSIELDGRTTAAVILEGRKRAL